MLSLSKSQETLTFLSLDEIATAETLLPDNDTDAITSTTRPSTSTTRTTTTTSKLEDLLPEGFDINATNKTRYLKYLSLAS